MTRFRSRLVINISVFIILNKVRNIKVSDVSLGPNVFMSDGFREIRHSVVTPSRNGPEVLSHNVLHATLREELCRGSKQHPPSTRWRIIMKCGSAPPGSQKYEKSFPWPRRWCSGGYRGFLVVRSPSDPFAFPRGDIRDGLYRDKKSWLVSKLIIMMSTISNFQLYLLLPTLYRICIPRLLIRAVTETSQWHFNYAANDVEWGHHFDVIDSSL